MPTAALVVLLQTLEIRVLIQKILTWEILLLVSELPDLKLELVEYGRGLIAERGLIADRVLLVV